MGKIILVSGKAASGKDTFAEVLYRGNPKVKVFPFARALKEVASMLWEAASKEKTQTYAGKAKARSYFIRLGSLIRDIDPYTWVDLVIRDIKKYFVVEPQGVAVITDWRFLNEGYRILDQFNNVSFIRISSTAASRKKHMGKRRFAEYVDSRLAVYLDVSETQLDLLEDSVFRYLSCQRTQIQLLQEHTKLCMNNASLITFQKSIEDCLKDIFSQMIPVMELKPLKEAFYRLARQLGPEARLCE